MSLLLGTLFALLPPALAYGLRRYVKRMPEQADPGFGTKVTATSILLVLGTLYGIGAGALLATHPVIGVVGFISLAFSMFGTGIWLARYDKNADKLQESGGIIRRFKTRMLTIYAYLAGKCVDWLQKSRVRAVIGVYENLVAEGNAQIEQCRRTEDKLKGNPDAKKERRNVQEKRREIQKEVGALDATVGELRGLLAQDAIPGLAVDRPALPEQVSRIPAQLGLDALPVISSTKRLPALEHRPATETEADAPADQEPKV